MKAKKIVWARACDSRGFSTKYDFYMKQQSEFRDDVPLRTVLKTLRKRDIKVFELRQEKGFWWYTTIQEINAY